MTGRGARELGREDIVKRFYLLQQFLGCYLHEDWPIIHGTPEKAVDAAISEYPVDLRHQVSAELAAVMGECQDDVQLRKVLNRALGVNVHFKKSAEARAFAEHIQIRLLASIKAPFECDLPQR